MRASQATYITLAILLFSQAHTRAQKMSGPEFLWALIHPVAAVKVKCISRSCKKFYDEKVKSNDPALDKFSSGGKLDAFRHVFYMSAFAGKIKAKKLRKLGVAHEKGNYRDFLRSKAEFGELPDSVSGEMDLINNEIGFAVGEKNKGMSLRELQNAALQAIAEGKAVIVKRDAQGNYLDCEGKRIDPEKFHGKWNIPKCLVSSDFIYPR